MRKMIFMHYLVRKWIILIDKPFIFARIFSSIFEPNEFSTRWNPSLYQTTLDSIVFRSSIVDRMYIQPYISLDLEFLVFTFSPCYARHRTLPSNITFLRVQVQDARDINSSYQWFQLTYFVGSRSRHRMCVNANT